MEDCAWEVHQTGSKLDALLAICAAENVAQAFDLLDAAAAVYKLFGASDGSFTAEVRIGRQVGKASAHTKLA